MTGLWTAFVLFCQLTVLQREPWIRPVPGVSLEPTRPVRQETDFGPDSAYRLLEKAASAIGDSSVERNLFDSQPWTDEQYAAVLQRLQAAEPGLVLARKAAAAPDPQIPTIAVASESPFGWQMKLGYTVRLLILSAYAKDRGGHPEEALDELTAALRCGQVATRGGPLVSRVAGEAGTGAVCEGLWRIAARNAVPAPVLRRKAQELLQISDGIEPMAETFRYEALMMDGEMARTDVAAQMAMSLSSGRGGQLASLLTGSSRAAARRDFHSFYQHCVQLADMPDIRAGEAWFRAFGKPPEDTEDLLRVACFTSDPVGLVLAMMMCGTYGNALSHAAGSAALMRGTALFLAIRSYETEQGRPPVRLADLIPEFLPRVPTDPFSGKPFRYLSHDLPRNWGSASWGIYSTGPDHTDNGGEPAGPLGPFRLERLGKAGSDMVWLAPEAPRQ